MATHLTPACGRDYQSREGVLAALKAGKDFLLQDVSSRWHGKPINLHQILNETVAMDISVRYAHCKKVATFARSDFLLCSTLPLAKV